ncbi:MAG: carboxypeptidase Taq [Solirubrobacteraceae bacterium]|nr:carboxypeptidase Taq [Solirubrobacteraceae bacterium]
MNALASLRRRLGELDDLGALGRLAAWDQAVMMPPAGGAARAQQLATLERLAHERGTSEEIGEWLEACEAGDGELAELDRDAVRLARRDWERARRVPVDLAVERAAAHAEGETIWRAARTAGSFAAFAPALARNVTLARAYAAAVADDGQGAYDALLADYNFGLSAEGLGVVFGRLAAELEPIVAEAGRRPAPPALRVPEEAQRAAVRRILARLGVDGEGWRVDESSHPFTVWLGPRDLRLTTRYDDGGLVSVLGALHEFGHGLYRRQMPADLLRTGLDQSTSTAVDESQSKLWEDQIGRHRAFAGVLAAELRVSGLAITPDEVHGALTDVRPTPIRVSADPVSYPLHVVARFELERALVEGTLDVVDLPAAWNEGMRRLLGIEVPDDRSGVLQDIHWATGAFGYFPSYALGSLIAAQLWEALERALGPREEALATADVAAIRTWLGNAVHRHGRRLDTDPLLERATGGPLSPDAFLRYVGALVG